MSKLSSFVLSVALVVLCIWLDISLFPNVARSVSPSADALVASESASDDANLDDPASAVVNAPQGLSHAGKEFNKSNGATKDGDSESPREEKRSDDADSSDQNPIQARLDSSYPTNENFVAEASERELTSPSVKAAAFDRSKNEQDSCLETVSFAKPQGGKYVSIPGIEMDPIRTAKFDSRGALREDVDSLDARVIGARRSIK